MFYPKTTQGQKTKYYLLLEGFLHLHREPQERAKGRVIEEEHGFSPNFWLQTPVQAQQRPGCMLSWVHNGVCVAAGREGSGNSELEDDQEAAPSWVRFIPSVRCTLIYEVIARNPDHQLSYPHVRCSTAPSLLSLGPSHWPLWASLSWHMATLWATAQPCYIF